MFLAKREVYEALKDRIGKKPFLFIMDEICSMDIDWEEDFELTQIVYNYKHKNINVLKLINCWGG